MRSMADPNNRGKLLRAILSHQTRINPAYREFWVKGNLTAGHYMPSVRRLADILAADVVGYSRLVGADEEGTLAALTALRREVAQPKIEQHHARIVRTTGDGLLIEFVSVVDAVRCAVEMQLEIAERNSSVPVDRRIEFRIGINLGDIINDGADIF